MYSCPTVAKAILFPWGFQESNSFVIFKWTPEADSVRAKQINVVTYTKCIQTRVLEERRRKKCCSKGNDGEKYACYRLGEGWENGSKFNLCPGSEEEIEDQIKGIMKGRLGLRRNLNTSQRGRFNKRKKIK